MMNKFGNTKTLTLLCSVVALAVSLAAGGYVLTTGAGTETGAQTGTIEISASAQKSGTPDTLSLALAVVTIAKSSPSSLNQNNAEMHHLQSIFLNAGVPKRNLQTSNLNVGPTYDNNSKITGYRTENDLAVTFHNIAKSGAVISDAENAVGNDVQINSISFSQSNTSVLLREARILAMHNARTKAQAFADGANEQLGAVIKITQSESSPVTPFEPVTNAAAGVAKSSVPIQPGRQDVSVDVNVTFRLID